MVIVSPHLLLCFRGLRFTFMALFAFLFIRSTQLTARFALRVAKQRLGNFARDKGARVKRSIYMCVLKEAGEMARK